MIYISRGFSLIEILVAVMISSMLSLVLYRSLAQTQSMVRQVTELIEDTSDLIPLYTQLEKDLAGSLVMDEKSTSTAQEGAPQKPAADQGPRASGPNKEKQKLFFQGKQEGGHFGSLTFLTTTAFTVFDEIAPPLLTVTYRLEQQQDTASPRFRLVREQAPYKAEKDATGSSKVAGRAYVVAENIKELRVSYVPVARKDDAKQAKSNEKSSGRVAVWDAETVASTKTLLPAQVIFEGVRYAGKSLRELPLLFTCLVPAARSTVVVDKSKLAPTSSGAQQPAAPPAPGKKTEAFSMTILKEVKQ